MRAYFKDIGQTIVKEKKRFFSIMIIAALGVMIATGIKAGCDDLLYTADFFYKQQNLHDIAITSTLGMTDDDVDALMALEGVGYAEGTYTKRVNLRVNGINKTADVKMLNEDGIDVPYVVQGSLPQETGEIAVTQNFIRDTALSIGDTMEFEADTAFDTNRCTITAIIVDPTAVNAIHGAASSIRSSTSSDYIFFVPAKAVNTEIYTSVLLKIEGSEELFCYSNDYKQTVSNMINTIAERIKSERETARTYQIRDEAAEKIEDEEKSVNSELDDAYKEIEDAQNRLNDAQKELEDKEKELNEKKAEADAEFEEAQQELENAKSRLLSGEDEIIGSEKELKQAYEEIEASEKMLGEGSTQQQMQLEMYKIQVEAGLKEIEDSWGAISGGWEDYYDGIQELTQKKQETYKKIEDARRELADGRAELEDSKKELEEKINEYDDKRREADEKIADAWRELDDIDTAKWYIFDRYNLGSYKNIETDSGAIAVIGKIFPIIFLAVAVLISLTTINRMVEENRGLIGTYQALGFTDGEIRFKYIIYALCASIIGGILGDVGGYIFLPQVIITVFKNMYILPEYYTEFNFIYGFMVPALFVAAIIIAAGVTCSTALKQMPAELMRPKAPKAGSRVLLENISFIWNRLSFLNKVTARNLFRYKKRMFMTIIGIAGCMTLLICGYAIKDTVTILMPRQYDEIYNFDMMAVASDDDNATLDEYMAASGDVADYMELRIETVRLKSPDAKTDMVQMYVIPDEEILKNYINVIDIDDGTTVSIEDGGVYITRNAGTILGFASGDKVIIQDTLLNEYEFGVSAMIENFTGNFIIMTQHTYENTYGEYKANAVLGHLNPDVSQTEFVSKVGKEDWVLSVMSAENMKEEFSVLFDLINMVVYIIIILAAALAFVVLFTLSTTNISERERELATIKVLGFYDKEVHKYVNKETIILTFIGIAVGIPLGSLVGHFLTYALTMPSIYFAVTIHRISYFISVGLTLLFAIIVNCITNHSLNVIDPVEALKSIE